MTHNTRREFLYGLGAGLGLDLGLGLDDLEDVARRPQVLDLIRLRSERIVGRQTDDLETAFRGTNGRPLCGRSRPPRD